MSLTKAAATKDIATVEIMDPRTGEPLLNECDGTPITIDVYGPYSAHRKSVNRAIQNRRMTLMKRSKKMEIKAEDIESAALEELVKCTAGWNLSVDSTGLLEFSEANVEDVYNTYPWLREQVEEVAQDARNFLE